MRKPYRWQRGCDGIFKMLPFLYIKATLALRISCGISCPSHHSFSTSLLLSRFSSSSSLKSSPGIPSGPMAFLLFILSITSLISRSVISPSSYSLSLLPFMLQLLALQRACTLAQSVPGAKASSQSGVLTSRRR